MFQVPSMPMQMLRIKSPSPKPPPTPTLASLSKTHSQEIAKGLERCPFANHGCSFADADRDVVQRHMKTANAFHIRLLGETLKPLRREVESAIPSELPTLVESVPPLLPRVFHCYSHQLVWRLDTYAHHRTQAERGKSPVVAGPEFLTHRDGYRLAVSLAPFGDGDTVREWVAVFVAVLPGPHDAVLPWPFEHRLTFTLFDQQGPPATRRHHRVELVPQATQNTMPFLQRPDAKRNPAFGLQRFVPVADMLEGGRFVRSDTVFLAVDVDLRTLNVDF